MENTELDPSVKKILHKGTVIPAHPLVLDENRQLDEGRQRRLTRYYLAAGVGGLAVGVHTTQFEIRKPEANLLETVLRLAAEEIDRAQLDQPFIKVAGIVGPTANVEKEAVLALKYGYHLGLVSLAGLTNYSDDELVHHIRAIAAIIPVFGFYLQPAVGGRLLSYDFWRACADIPNVFAIKIAPFNRYQTLDVVRAVCASGRRNEIALYTGNDDNIVADLLTPFRFNINGERMEKRIVGGLLGHWAAWTKKAVELFHEIKQGVVSESSDLEELLAKGVAVTDMNAALFDAAHSFKGCIPGIHEVLRRQGLLEGTWCINLEEKLSIGQTEELDRIYKMYPQLTDDAFVKEFLEKDKKLFLERTIG